MKILWHENAWDDYCAWQTEDKKTLKKLNALIKDIQRSPFDGIGKPKPLKERPVRGRFLTYFLSFLSKYESKASSSSSILALFIFLSSLVSFSISSNDGSGITNPAII